MALIRCPECGREISDRAAACPGCGCPVERPDPRDALLEDARKKDRAFLKRTGGLCLLGIMLFLTILALMARGGI